MTSARAEAIRRGYDAFNQRDIESAIDLLAADVDWPDMLAGKRLHGHDEVRDYWRRQFEQIHSTVTPRDIREEGDDVIVLVHQRVLDAKEGRLLADDVVVHVWTFRGERVVRMDVRQPGG